MKTLLDEPLDDALYENHVYEGGGVHGLAYIGVIRALEERDGELSKLRRVGGTSIGALVAALLACALTSADMERELGRLTKHTVFGSPSLCRLLVNVVRRFGVYDMSLGMRAFLADLMSRYMDNADITFQQLEVATGRELHVTVFNSTRMRSETISPLSHPNVKVVDALVAAISVQAMFVPLLIPGVSATDLYSDGGLTNNMPLALFDDDDAGPNRKTLGIRSVASTSLLFASDIAYVPPPPRNIVEYLSNLASLLLEAGQQRYERPRDAERTLFLKMPADIGSFDFDVSAIDRTRLILLGYDAMTRRLASLSSTQ